MSRTCAIAFGLAALLASGPAQAAKASLPVTGRTLGGPGTVRLEPSEFRSVVGGDGVDLCATVVNGKSALELRMREDGTSEIVLNRFLNPGESITACALDIDIVQLRCVGPKKCDAAWRVDLL